ncbi:MAG: hypothetical protein WCO06_06970 [Candidatus Roizmanbacteria bacterium]
MILALIITDLMNIGVFAFKYSSLPPQIPLFYSLNWGEDQLVDTWIIGCIPLLSHIFFFLNLYTYNRFFFPDTFIKKIMEYSNWAIIITSTLIFIRLIIFIG